MKIELTREELDILESLLYAATDMRIINPPGNCNYEKIMKLKTRITNLIYLEIAQKR